MKITKIEKTKKGKFALFFNDEFEFSISPDQLYKEGLKKGSKISEDEKTRIYKDSQEYYAREKAILLLSRRNYTRQQLFNKLNDIAEDSIAEDICDRMEELGLINDEDYAIRRTKDLYNIKKYGQYRVYMDLFNKGIADELATKISLELEPENISEILYEIIEKKHKRKFLKINDFESYFKCVNSVQSSLIRLGYGFDNVKNAINEYMFDNEINY